MSGGGGTTTTVQSNQPPSYAAPYLTQIAKDAYATYRPATTPGAPATGTSSPQVSYDPAHASASPVVGTGANAFGGTGQYGSPSPISSPQFGGTPGGTSSGNGPAFPANGQTPGAGLFAPYQGSTVVPWDPRTQQSLDQQQQIANGSQPLINATMGGILGNLSNNGINATAMPGIQGLQGYASGQYLNGGSPEFQKALDFQTQQTADDVNRQFSGMGRYGSGDHAGVLASQIGNLRNNAMAQELAREQALQQSAAGQLISAGQGGNANMLQAAALAPTADQFQYAPAERLAQIGSAYEQQAGNNLQDTIEKYYGNQQAPLQNLQFLSDMINGVSRNYGTSSTTSPKATTGIASGILGGALAGGSIGSGIPVVGTGLGALGGGLLGGLGSVFR